MNSSLSQYLREISKHLEAGNATEHTFRPALKTMIEGIGKDLTATNEPKHIDCGAPDFIVSRGAIPIGYIEAKDVGKNLDEVVRSEQVIRYLEALQNLILTDYLEFRLYQNGDYRMSARLAHLGPQGKVYKEKDGAANFQKLIESFLSSELPTINTPKDLASRMAGSARLLREIIITGFETEDTNGLLHNQFEGFRDILLPNLKPPQFADMYAQTICYGLFAARCNHDQAQGPFTREKSIFEMPETNPFLGRIFDYLAGPNLDDRLIWAVDQIVHLLAHADIAGILTDFGRRTRREDPVVHFYETFLAEYDPKLRETRGVYYTPEPVVNYIVKSVHELLKRDFGIPDGLASAEKIRLSDGTETHRVIILDPATGTGTFLQAVIELIFQEITTQGQRGMWDGYVSEHLLPRLFGFELLMAPYAIAHMKLALKLAQTGYTFRKGERLNVYLTNTLEEAFYFKGPFLLAKMIAEEANEAGNVKKKAPVMVVLGNPPYSGHSVNKSDWMHRLLRGFDTVNQELTDDYFKVDGSPLGERNPKWLNDDYVKFIRFAQWRIERTGYGILAFVTNHGYLDNPTFRGMRQSLMKTFDDIYVLDLHGNAKKKEVAPDGSKDENVFDIQQGVAICLMVKKP